MTLSCKFNLIFFYSYCQSSLRIKIINPRIEAKEARNANLPENIVFIDLNKFLEIIDVIFSNNKNFKILSISSHYIFY